MYNTQNRLQSHEELAVRIDDTNRNHHIWNNNGTWWVHYTIYPTPVTAERRRRSLRTNDTATARVRRDALFLELALEEESKAA
jgi:hypothetical protein